MCVCVCLYVRVCVLVRCSFSHVLYLHLDLAVLASYLHSEHIHLCSTNACHFFLTQLLVHRAQCEQQLENLPAPSITITTCVWCDFNLFYKRAYHDKRSLVVSLPSSDALSPFTLLDSCSLVLCYINSIIILFQNFKCM